jgi:hypothetical protein
VRKTNAIKTKDVKSLNATIRAGKNAVGLKLLVLVPTREMVLTAVQLSILVDSDLSSIHFLRGSSALEPVTYNQD